MVILNKLPFVIIVIEGELAYYFLIFTFDYEMGYGVITFFQTPLIYRRGNSVNSVFAFEF